MGAEPWLVFTAYRENLQQALLEVQDREFQSGSWDPTGILAEEGLEPRSIDELREMLEDTGTGSVLDMLHVGDSPDFFTVSPIPADQLVQLFGTAQPTRAMVEANDDYFEDIGRGQGRYIILYQDGQPSEIAFAGYSFD